jgi:hypothetical protein
MYALPICRFLGGQGRLRIRWGDVVWLVFERKSNPGSGV